MLATMSVSVGEPAFQAQVPHSLPVNGEVQGNMTKKDANDLTLHINPVLQYDMKAKVLLFQIVDPVSGEIEQQYPSEKKLEAYQKAMEEQAFSPSEIEGSDRNVPAGNHPDATGVGGELAKTVSAMGDRDLGEGLSLVA